MPTSRSWHNTFAHIAVDIATSSLICLLISTWIAFNGYSVSLLNNNKKLDMTFFVMSPNEAFYSNIEKIYTLNVLAVFFIVMSYNSRLIFFLYESECRQTRHTFLLFFDWNILKGYFFFQMLDTFLREADEWSTCNCQIIKWNISIYYTSGV